MKPLFAFIIITIVLTGCFSNTESFSSDINKSPLNPGMAQLIIFYPSAILGSEDPVRVKFQNSNSCILKSGNYLIKEIAPGDQVIAFSPCGKTAVSNLHLKIIAGEKYYLQVVPYDGTLLGLLSGYPTDVVYPGSPPHDGPFAIERMDEITALAKLQSLTPATNNAIITN